MRDGVIQPGFKILEEAGHELDVGIGLGHEPGRGFGAQRVRQGSRNAVEDRTPGRRA